VWEALRWLTAAWSSAAPQVHGPEELAGQAKVCARRSGERWARMVARDCSAVGLSGWVGALCGIGPSLWEAVLAPDCLAGEV